MATEFPEALPAPRQVIILLVGRLLHLVPDFTVPGCQRLSLVERLRGQEPAEKDVNVGQNRRFVSYLRVSTNKQGALGLGIDVGAFEACVIAGYPGTLASFFQQCSVSKCTVMLQPFEQPLQTLSTSSRNQTRILKRKSLVVSAPTGQMSATFIE